VQARLFKFSLILLLLISGFSLPADSNLPLLSLNMKQQHYKLQIADSLESRLRGLMFRSQLGRDEGMLFVYPASGDHRIWMKNTLIPLTVIWMNKDARILEVKLLLPCEQPSCPVYAASEPSSFIIELHQTQYHYFKKGNEFPRLKGLLNSLTASS
jgi:uncharacterized protein